MSNSISIRQNLKKNLKGSTFICGFPGETDAHIEEICDFLNRKKLRTFRTNKYYTPKLIYMTIKK